MTNLVEIKDLNIRFTGERTISAFGEREAIAPGHDNESSKARVQHGLLAKAKGPSLGAPFRAINGAPG